MATELEAVEAVEEEERVEGLAKGTAQGSEEALWVMKADLVGVQLAETKAAVWVVAALGAAAAVTATGLLEAESSQATNLGSASDAEASEYSVKEESVEGDLD